MYLSYIFATFCVYVTKLVMSVLLVRECLFVNVFSKTSSAVNVLSCSGKNTHLQFLSYLRE